MKILYIVPSLIQAGPVNVVRDLTRVMMEHGHDCEVAYFDDIKNRPLNNFQCRCFKHNDIKWNNYDIIHTHGFRPDLIAKLRAPRSVRNRLISTMHNLVFEENAMIHGRLKGGIISRLELWAASSHRFIVTLTNVAKEYYTRYFTPEKLTVCCNTCFLPDTGPNQDEIATIANFRESSQAEYLIGTHCFISLRKGLEQVIKALPLLPKVSFVIIGSGPEQSALEEIAKKLNVTNRVLFLGHKKDAARLLPLLDLYVIPSRSEGFPLALLEAAASGVPSVSSDIDIFKETFPDHILPKFKLDNIDSISETLKNSLEARKELGNKIQQHFLEAYSPEVFYNQHISLYKKIANK
ncbi:MAG: glycosyltransferase family 4 protein [Bacteroides sp.]|nr:glycosyltransferase family 4 protein [Bacteroides sp.]